MFARASGIVASAALLGTGAAVLPASPAHAHDLSVSSADGVGFAAVFHTGSDHRDGGVCSNGGQVTGWFWFGSGNPQVWSRSAAGCTSLHFDRSVVYFYACDHKGCGDRGYP